MGHNIYHYCSLDTFNSIITNKTIRLSDVSKSNDYYERTWVLKNIEEALNDFFNEKGLKFDLRYKYQTGYPLDNPLEMIFEELNYYIRQSSFVSCFSTEGDLLSQWRAYAKNGLGVSIGFDKKTIFDIEKRKSELFVDFVKYEKKDQIDEIKFAAECAFVETKPLYKEMYIGIYDSFEEFLFEEFEVFCEYFARYLLKGSCLIKNPAFKEEKEVRIVYAPILNEWIDVEILKETVTKTFSSNRFKLNKMNYKIHDDKVIASFDLTFNNHVKEGIIKEIIIGPSSKITSEDLKIILLLNGFDINNIIIRKSEASYQIK